MLIARGCVSTGKRVANVAIKITYSTQFPQGFLDSLPSYVSDLPFLVVRRMGQDNSHRDFKVRRTRLSACDALVWLTTSNILDTILH